MEEKGTKALKNYLPEVDSSNNIFPNARLPNDLFA